MFFGLLNGSICTKFISRGGVLLKKSFLLYVDITCYISVVSVFLVLYRRFSKKLTINLLIKKDKYTNIIQTL